MTNPTSNFGWQMPTSTDLVTDLPADFAVFGQAVDTSMADLKGGTTGQILSKATSTDMDFTWITNDVGDITAVTAGTGITGGGTTGAVTITNDMATTITAAGDIVVGTGSGTYDNLPIGTTGQILTADTTVSPYKVKWATPASSGGMTVLASGSLSGSSLDLSSISGSYNNLQLVLRGMTYSASVTGFSVLANTISDYTMNVLNLSNATFQTDGGSSRGSISPFYNTMIAAQTGSALVITIFDYTNTTSWKHVQCQFVSTYAGPNIATDFTYATVKSTAAIDRLRCNPGGGTYSTGTYTLYGVK
jgi:hypothetical protein